MFPGLLVASHAGTVRTPSELQGRDPLILLVARSNYCPGEHKQRLRRFRSLTTAITRSPGLAGLSVSGH
jgi:hypothetical protein